MIFLPPLSAPVSARAARGLRAWGLALLLGAGLAPAAPALAGGLRVSPLRLDISPRRPVTQIELTNLEQKPITAQVEVNAWTVKDGVDVLTPTDDLQFVPPIVSVPPGGRRTVRVRLRAAADVQTEKAYRLYVQEITAVTNLDETELNELASGAQFNIRFGVPLFVQPIRRSLAEVETATERADGALRVTVRNPGEIHLRVSSVAAYPPATPRDRPLPTPLASAARPPNASLYIMPGDDAVWTFTGVPVPSGSQLLVQTDAYSSQGHGNLLPSGRVWLTAP